MAGILTRRRLVAMMLILAACSGATEHSPTFDESSADGMIFASSRDSPQIELYYIRKDGFVLKRLTNNNVTEGRPTVSPDGQRVAYECNQDICVMDIDGSNQVQLTTDPTLDAYPTWSPDGGTIAFVSDRDGWRSNIWLMDANGANQRALTVSDTFWIDQPRFSPTGDRLIARATAFELSDLVLVDASSGVATTYLANDTELSRPSWSPDGERILYTVVDHSGTHLATRKLNRKNPVTIRIRNQIVTDGAWSQDGNEITASCIIGTEKLCRFSPSGDSAIVIPGVPLPARTPAWVQDAAYP